MCISPLASGACGAERSFAEGSYKFSVFGYTNITNAFKLPTFGSANTPATEFGVRSKLTLVGATGGIDLRFNNDPTLTIDVLGSTAVTSFAVRAGNLGTINYAFHTDYNIGDVPTGDATT